MLVLWCFAPCAQAQTTVLTVNDSTGAVNVPSGLTANFSALKIGGVTLSAAPAWSSITGVGSTTGTEIGYIHGLTSAVQTQIDAKAPLLPVDNSVHLGGASNRWFKVWVGDGGITTQGGITIGGGASITSSGPGGALTSAAYTTVGTAANNLVKLDGAAKLPAVDGSQLTNLPGGGGGGSSSNYTVKTSDYTAVAGDRIGTDSTGGSFTITLPASPSDGDAVVVADVTGTAYSFAISIVPASGTIDGLSSITLGNPYDSRVVTYSAAQGWRSLGLNRATATQLLDSTNVLALDFSIRKLLGSSGEYSVDWVGRNLTDSGTVRGLDWQARKLYSADGATVALDWSSSTTLTIYGVTAAIMSIDASWAANASAGDKNVSVADYTPPGDFSGSDTTDLTKLSTLASQVQALTKKLQALETALAAKLIPSN